MSYDTSILDKDVAKSLSYLENAFDKVTRNMPRAVRTNKDGPNELYKLQVEFMYLLNEITREPKFTALNAINRANVLINKLKK